MVREEQAVPGRRHADECRPYERSHKCAVGWFSGERPVAQGGVGHLLEFISVDATRGLHGDAERQGGDIAGQEPRIGIGRQIAVVDGSLEPLSDAGAGRGCSHGTIAG